MMGIATADGAMRAYDNLDLHPEIERAASDLCRNGYYAHTIEGAVMVLTGLVRMRSGKTLDGAELKEKVLPREAPSFASAI
jgi:hypothetical protein